MTEQEKAQISEAVSQVLAEYTETIKIMDLGEVRDFWADTDGFVIAGDGALISSHSDWISKVEEMWADIEKVNSAELFNPHVFVLAEDAAAYSMEFKTTITTKDGNTAGQRGSWLYVFKYLDGRWRAVQSAGTHLPD